MTLTPDTALDKTVSASTLTYTFTMPARRCSYRSLYRQAEQRRRRRRRRWSRRRRCCTGSDRQRLVLHYRTGRHKVPATVEVKNGTAAVSADSSKLTAVSGKDSLTLDLSADSTVRTVSLTGDVVAALAGARTAQRLPCRIGTVALDRETLTALGSAAQADGMAKYFDRFR